MEISEQRRDDIIVLGPVGRINNDSSADFQTKLLGCVGSTATKVLIDFSGVEYISSAGLRALLMASKQSKAANGRLAVAASHTNGQGDFRNQPFLARRAGLRDHRRGYRGFDAEPSSRCAARDGLGPRGPV